MVQSSGADAGPLEVLLVEDSPGDVRLMQEAFKDAEVLINLHVASDGTEVMVFLRREKGHANAPRPDLILLDLNLPKKDGREVLNEIKQRPTLKSIPVVILTTHRLRRTFCRVICSMRTAISPSRWTLRGVSIS
jgi:two-component system, chemotaxis family, response regulator Rcp1